MLPRTSDLEKLPILPQSASVHSSSLSFSPSFTALNKPESLPSQTKLLSLFSVMISPSPCQLTPSCRTCHSLLQPLNTPASTSARPPARPYYTLLFLVAFVPLLPPALISLFPSLFSPLFFFLLPYTYYVPYSYNTFIFAPSQSTHPPSVPYFLFIPQSLSIFLPTHGTLPLILNKEAASLPHMLGEDGASRK